MSFFNGGPFMLLPVCCRSNRKRKSPLPIGGRQEVCVEQEMYAREGRTCVETCQSTKILRPPPSNLFWSAVNNALLSTHRSRHKREHSSTVNVHCCPN
ncbi:hypothetical protein BCR44DRAFT_1438515 [Catenaria anguillulae PL171]|uniref:Uncharacterized protein n=1 Tax=Catenaria anguillulae PL171 TaxID=765915 RepID=A0A1Y2HFS7_9FUNG|nr:hypothetical protein BCR44DRAFT_1438515 [Catenaria anguillulae PL171]